ncbi:hypothetical protein [Patulibacter minatonensis]|uniref:hypothetical protein n=1 Tax=Patulibacter minatonensis TaxID=298163 RepID=UPI0012F71063|nr:hypothetical protein [Patulibacter minatonensis]
MTTTMDLLAFSFLSLPPLAEAGAVLATLVLGGAVGAGVVAWLTRRRRARGTTPPGRILLALTGDGLPCAAIDAAARLARADHAVVVPAVLLPTPYGLALDRPSPDSGSDAMDLLEAVERRLTSAGVQVDGRVVQGRTRRHAIRRLVEQERHDRLVVPAGGADDGGLSADDVGWLLGHVDGEVLVLRADAQHTMPAAISPAPVARRGRSAATSRRAPA